MIKNVKRVFERRKPLSENSRLRFQIWTTRFERILFIFFTRTSLYFHTFSTLYTFLFDCVH